MHNFKRKCYQELVNWKQQKQRKPLILQGARQVGKTHLIKQFADNEFASQIYINFEKHESVMNYFQEDLEPKRIIENLSLHFDQDITTNTLLIFDEIQECDSALTSLKYFNEELPEQPILCAGSLLGVKLNRGKGFPVGKVDFQYLYPLGFIEFLYATNNQRLAEYIQTLKISDKIAEPIHNKLIDLLKKYFIIGGMPAVIKKYVTDNNFDSVRHEQENILNAYQNDFIKHAEPTEVMKITDTWNSIPKQLAKDNKKFKYAQIQKNARSREYHSALQWLLNAGLILPAYHISKPALPLKSYASLDVFKIYSLDVGLLGAQSGLSPKTLLDGMALFTEFKGALAENFAIQELRANSYNDIFYWTEGNQAEVDFILSHAKNPIPLEIKAGNNLISASLKKYQNKFKPNLSIKGSLMNLTQQDNLLNVPLYLLSKLKDWLE